MSNQNGPNEQSNYHEESDLKKREETVRLRELEQQMNGAKALFRTTLVGTFVAIVAAMAALWSGYEAHETRIEDERPFLTASAGEVTGFYWPNISIDLAASGKTPSMSIRASCMIADGSSKAIWPAPGDEPITEMYGAMFPGQTRPLNCSEDTPFTNQNAVIAYGVVYYSNKNGERYQTPFCQTIYRKVGPPEKFASRSCPEESITGQPSLK